MTARPLKSSKAQDSSSLRALSHLALRLAFGDVTAKEAYPHILAEGSKIGINSLESMNEIFDSNLGAGEIEDPRLRDLIEQALSKDVTGHLLNILYAAKGYNGVLHAAVVAGSLATISKQVGVSPQAVQKWVEQGFVPLARIPEFESLYGVPRAELVNRRYMTVLAAPNFSSDV